MAHCRADALGGGDGVLQRGGRLDDVDDRSGRGDDRRVEDGCFELEGELARGGGQRQQCAGGASEDGRDRELRLESPRSGLDHRDETEAEGGDDPPHPEGFGVAHPPGERLEEGYSDDDRGDDDLELVRGVFAEVHVLSYLQRPRLSQLEPL